jgi:hypothetical protein
MITVREDDFGSYPVIICDTCKVVISGNYAGIVVWRLDESEKARFVHKRVVSPKCDDDDYDQSMEIEAFLDLLVKNTLGHEYD